MYPRIEFRYLDEPAMIEAGVRDMSACIDAMAETLVLLMHGDYRMAGEGGDSHGAMITFPKEPAFPDMPKDGSDRRFMAMPAYLGGQYRATGVKWYGSNLENRELGLPRSVHLFVLNDTDTGAPKAIMSANLISAYRTGAVPGVAVRHLARQDAKVLGLIGPGVIGRSVTEAALTERPSIDTIVVKGVDEADENRFRDYAAQRFPQVRSIVSASSVQDLVEKSDVVTATVTTDPRGPEGFPFIDSAWLKPGALLLHPAAVRYDDGIFTRENTRFVVDYQGLYEAWQEEMGTAAYAEIGIVGNHWYDLAARGEFDLARVENIGAIIEGTRPARENDEQVFVYSAGGMPVEDVAWAHRLFERAQEKGLGVKLPLWDEPALA